MEKLRKYLSAAGLLTIVRKAFSKVSDKAVPKQRQREKTIGLTDCLMAGLAVFGLKSSSLLQFDQRRKLPIIAKNLQNLYGLHEVPCDTQMRTRLDVVEPQALRGAFNKVFAVAQRGKALEEFVYYDRHYLMSLDATGQYQSDEVHCEECCVKQHKNGTTSYYHQMLGAVIVHPDRKIVVPLAPEAITRQDGAKKNDCERNAAKRLLTSIRREHPHLKLIVVEDGLASNAPHIELLKSLNMRFILGAKPDDHEYLYDWVSHAAVVEHEETTLDGVAHHYRYVNGAPLNDANQELKVNFLDYWEIKANGKRQHFSWVTDIPLTRQNVKSIMRGGRARWKIENETFNTLKNQGYHFEHNYGHGNQHLCSVFTMLMVLAFLLDQLQELCCTFYKAARIASFTKQLLWEQMRVLLHYHLWESWEQLYTEIVASTKQGYQPLNTS